MTKNDLKQIDSLIQKNLKVIVTRKDLVVIRNEMKVMKKELKEDIDEAVVQVIGAVDNVVSPLARRVTRIEEHLDLPGI